MFWTQLDDMTAVVTGKCWKWYHDNKRCIWDSWAFGARSRNGYGLIRHDKRCAGNGGQKMRKQMFCRCAWMEILILSAVFLLAETVLPAEYLFGWVAHHWEFYVGLSFIALLFLFGNKRFVSAFMTVGITAGLFIGNFLGAAIKNNQESKILESMKAEEIYRLRHHPGFEIWTGILFVFIVLGAMVQLTQKKKKTNIE